jgi:hypothetical protein
MMAGLAAATVLVVLVRKYQAAQGKNWRMSKGVLQHRRTSPATNEG